MTVVADGAARLAAVLSNQFCEDSDGEEAVLINDVTPLSLGIV